MWAMLEPSGPMLKGTTYMVRPAMLPSNRGCSRARISAGAFQLLVGPASSFLSEQLKVRSSTRATSLGAEQASKLLVLFVAAISPHHVGGLAQGHHVGHPGDQLGVLDV